MQKELEAEAWCPKCHTYYGQIFRVRVGNDTWTNETTGTMPKYCSICEIPVERKR